MAIETYRWWETSGAARSSIALRLRTLRILKHFFGHYRFNSITRRIIVINFFGVAILVAGILYLNTYRVKFTETRVESLRTQAAIIASAVGQMSKDNASSAEAASENKVVLGSTFADTELSFRIDPETIAPMLRDLVGPTKTRARVFDTGGALVADSQQLSARGQNPRIGPAERDTDPLSHLWAYLKAEFSTTELPIYKDMGPDGKAYDEVRIALAGSPAEIIRVTESGETVISIAAPIWRDNTIQQDRTPLGALMLTTQGSDIDEIIARERLQIVYIAALVIVVTGILSWLLSGTIAGPMRRLAIAAERVRKNIKNREQIPDFSSRPDEIGYLSRAFRDMTNALYLRLDAIESFAADVSHELKNPLTSLRSAAGMLGYVKQDADRQKLIDIIQHDVRRLDRLITDIADASRLDAELARETAKPVNLASLLATLCDITREGRTGSNVNIVLRVQGCASPEDFANSKDYVVTGHDSRLSQVIINLIDNAISFSPKGGSIFVSAKRVKKRAEIEIFVEDEGPGISAENLNKIFDRFYTDRPGAEEFGQNSGLGLNISQQIVKAHGGRIWAENRLSAEPVQLKARKPGKRAKRIEPTSDCEHAIGAEETFACGVTKRHSCGARFVIKLPACSQA
jgi:two-component system sensor histidine kinase ChvG